MNIPPFRNEPVRRFTDESERIAFAAALETVRARLGGIYPLSVGGQDRSTAQRLNSINPAEPSQIVGIAGSASAADAQESVSAALEAFAAWRQTPVGERAAILLRAAELMRRRRDELAAWEVFEAGKPWREADADVCEAIDFLEYYAREALRLWPGHTLDVPGETNRYFYEPRGVVVVISPWNFPLAILCGMSAAAVAAGNSVVMKPAPQTPVIAWHYARILHEAGLPAGVLNYLPGGDEAGEALVRDPRVAMIAFTGSVPVGTHIRRAAAEIAPGQEHVKHVIAELGGKNAIIIDADADLDEAVLGTVASAFAYAGQKCSACSRAIVVGDLYESFLRRLTEAASSVRMGPPIDPGVLLGPVIDREAYDRIRRVIQEAEAYARPLLRPQPQDNSGGYFIGPTIFADVPPDSYLAQNEVFGPVLAVFRAPDFDDALESANSTRYALTGGVYSRSPGHLQAARQRFRVGNLYLNRKITGAIVGRQPFGGFKLSGTDAKAGGPDYLLHFVNARCVTENTIRRGFAPDVHPGPEQVASGL